MKKRIIRVVVILACLLQLVGVFWGLIVGTQMCKIYTLCTNYYLFATIAESIVLFFALGAGCVVMAILVVFLTDTIREIVKELK